MKILLTSTSFIDTPGSHQEELSNLGFDVDKMRGPLKESELLPIINQYDALICGDDEITEQVLIVGTKGKLKAISKYGIGLDKIDLPAAKRLNIPIANTPGVNHVTVAEHTFALILAFYKNLYLELNYTKSGKWKRLIGHEIIGKNLSIFGLGRIGKEVSIRAKAFGLHVKVYDLYPDMEFIDEYSLELVKDVNSLFYNANIITLHSPLTKETQHMLDESMFNSFKNQPLVVNTARANLVDKKALIYALDDKKISGYITDVMWEEPIEPNEELLKYKNVLITPHIGSRTYESVERQGLAAVKNLIELLKSINHEW